MTDDEFDAYLAQATDELRTKQDALTSEFGLGRHKRFVVDYEAGTLIFFRKEAPVVQAEILPVATHMPSKHSLKWSWANEQLPQSIRKQAAKVKKLHALTGFQMFANEVVECDESMAWEVTALACKHLSGVGAYRVPHGNLQAYVLLTTVKHIG